MSTYQTPSLTDLSRLTGIYTCDVGGEATAFEIRLEDAELVINDMPWMWAKQRLLPQEGNVFYVAGKPYEIEFDGDLHGEVKSFHVSTQLDWGMPKQVFPRIRSL